MDTMPLASNDPDLLEALAEHGGRDLVLRQFQAIGDMGTRPLPDALENTDTNLSDPQAVAATAAQDFNAKIEKWGGDEYEHWKREVESLYGEQADEYA